MLWQFDWSTIRAGHHLPKRRVRDWAGLPIALLMVLAILGPAAPAMAACQDLLADNTYRCRVKADDADNFVDCFSFVTPGALSEDFDLFSLSLDGTLGCDCKSAGTFAAPRFGRANAFHCVTPPDFGLGLAFEGRVNRRGRQLLAEAVNDTGTSFRLRCVRVSACELPAVPQGAAAPSW
jgi:hypothetical protein